MTKVKYTAQSEVVSISGEINDDFGVAKSTPSLRNNVGMGIIMIPCHKKGIK